MTKNKEKSNLNASKEWRERSEPLVAVPEDEREHPPHSLPRLSVVLPDSSCSSIDDVPTPPRNRKPLSHGDESMTVVLSAFYAKLLIVLGIALPVTSTIQNELYTNVTCDLFSMYLYIVSMLFLGYTFYHLRLAKRDKEKEGKRGNRNDNLFPLRNNTACLVTVIRHYIEFDNILRLLGVRHVSADVLNSFLCVCNLLVRHEKRLKKLKLANTGTEYDFVPFGVETCVENIKRIRYGSFYLHIGVAGFGVGSIIYSCLQFGAFYDLSGDCRLAVVAIKPILRIFYLVAQTVFIFSYTDILDPMRGVVLDRFGLMHLIATNVCEWLNVVVQETRDDIIAVAYDRPNLLRYVNISGHAEIDIVDELDNLTIIQVVPSLKETSNDSIITNLTDQYLNFTTQPDSLVCNVSDMITPLIRNVNPYLRPCGVEYSLLCSIIIAVIWNDICTVPGSKTIKKSNSGVNNKGRPCCGRVKSNNHFSVDCGSAHKGLFMGIAVLAGTIVSLMLFNGLFQNQKHIELALLQINVWESILFIIMTVGSGACIQRMRTLPLRRAVSAMPLEHALLLVTQCGVYLYYLFQIIGAGFLLQRFPEGSRATRIISPLCAVVQSSCQTLLVLDAWTRRCHGTGRQRPGRQLVTFLLVGNFALWLLNRVKNARAEFHPLQMEFYGVWAWTLITHVSVPLLVCYRFQATVCFYEIWKNSYKRKKDFTDHNSDGLELKNHHVA